MKNFSKKLFEQTNDISNEPLIKKFFVGYEPKYWVRYKKTDFLYKQDDRHQLGFFELFCSHVAQIVGYDCVNCYPAEDGVSCGVIVESYISPTTICTFSLQDILDKYDFNEAAHVGKMGSSSWFSTEEFFNGEEQLNRDGIYFAPDLREKFEQMILVDYLLAQMDRNERNVEFLMHEDPKTGKRILSLAPMYDNGRMLGATMFNQLATPLELSQDAYPQMTLEFLDKKPGTTVVENAAWALAKQITKKPHLAKIYNGFKKLNFLNEVYTVQDKCGYNLSDSVVSIMEKIYKDRMELLDRYIEAIIKQEKLQSKQSNKEYEKQEQFEELVL